MSVSSHRKLNVEQLINLAQVYWDDPTKLMEIADASEGRVDPAAQLLFGAISNRLERLRRDPMQALGEEAPDLAALIAARLGKTSTTEEEAAADAAEASEEKKKPSRRRSGLVLAGGATALLVALVAWWLWPAAKPAKETLVREMGAEVQEIGERVEEALERRGASPSALPSGRRRPAFPEPREREPGERELSLPADAAEVREARRRPATTGAAQNPDEANEARAARAAAAGAASNASGRGAAGGGGAGQPPGAGAPARQRSANRATPGGAGGAGTDMSESQLECFLADSRPTACAASPAGGPGSGGGAASGGAGGGGSGSAPAASAPPARTASSAPPASSPSPSSRDGSAPSAGRGSSGAAGGGGGGGSEGGAANSGAGSSPARGRPAAQASGGGGGGAQAPRQRPPTQQPSLQDEPPPDPDCPTEPPQGRVVFIFDGSVSMGLPLGIDPAEEDRLDDGARRRDPEARREYRELLRELGPKRMGRAQDAFAEAAEELPDFVELGLVVFQECRDIRQVGVFDAARRGSAIDYVRGLVPRGRTPLAQSLVVAQEMLGDKPASIVLLTDGREFCNGDPCAVAGQLKAARPGLPIHIIDIAGQGRTECVAEITGGRSYAPSETDDLTQVIRAAFRGAAPRCPAR